MRNAPAAGNVARRGRIRGGAFHTPPRILGPAALGGRNHCVRPAEPYAAGSVLCDSLFCAIHVSADSTSASSLAVNPSILTPVASAFFLASSAAATECTHTKPRRTLAVNFCCFSSFITRLLENCLYRESGTIHDYNRGKKPSPLGTTALRWRDPICYCRR